MAKNYNTECFSVHGFWGKFLKLVVRSMCSSVVGPLLFLKFINHMQIVSESSEVFLFIFC